VGAGRSGAGDMLGGDAVAGMRVQLIGYGDAVVIRGRGSGFAVSSLVKQAGRRVS
jgi:hypothetical protein